MREHLDNTLEYMEKLFEEQKPEDGSMVETELEEDDELGIELIDLYGRDKIVKRTEGKKNPDKNTKNDEKVSRRETKEEDSEETFDPVKELFSFLMWFVMAVVIAMLMQRFIIINANIPSGSMENTIMTGDRVIGNRLSYLFGSPERGDIVIFKYPDDERQLFVKRVIGMPGETVVIEDAKVYIDGVLLEENYLKEDWVIDAGSYTFVVPENSYLVLGDNRNNSKDSRYWRNTYVQEEQILGEAVFCYWPFENFGKLD
jgi:signal peptidase I